MGTAEPRIWLVTGASSGFGRELAEAALEAGDVVVATARRLDRLDELARKWPSNAVPIGFDVTETGAADRIVCEIVGRFGRLDVLVNNAGRTLVGAVEETSDAELRALFELHLFGPAALIRAALPHMRGRGGWIVQMSSMGGQLSFAGFGAYSATKCALEGLSEALAEEVGPHGIRVLVVEPGAFRTSLFEPGAAQHASAMPEYSDTVGKTRSFVETGDGVQPGDPAKAARAILAALAAPKPPFRLALGGDTVDAFRAHHAALAADLDAWEATSRATAFD
jgi:NAD(P)-dependent dehydrogenase (short-subunit alcohol dehydrogenase family)